MNAPQSQNDLFREPAPFAADKLAPRTHSQLKKTVFNWRPSSTLQADKSRRHSFTYSPEHSLQETRPVEARNGSRTTDLCK